MDEDERWAAIPGFSRYEVSSLGNVRRVADKYQMKPVLDGGYLRLRLPGDDKKRYARRVHCLVALAFLQNPDNLPSVDHIDRNKVNNALINLRWASMVTQRANRSHPKIDCKRRKVNQINMATGEVEKVWGSATIAMRETKIGGLGAVCRGEYKQAGGYFWEYTTQPLMDGEEFRQAFTDHTRTTPIEKTFVSNFGRVRKKNGRIGVGSLDSNGYLMTSCCTDNYKMSRLVAFSWLDYVEGCTQVNHIDFNRKNNHYTNLEWVTGTDNMIHNAIHGDAREIEQYSLSGDLIEVFPCLAVASRETKIPKGILCGALRPTTLRSKGFIFKYKGVGDSVNVILKKIRDMYKSVIQYDLQMNEIGRFDNLTLASKETGIAADTIGMHIMRKSRGPCMKQFYFKYEEDK